MPVTILICHFLFIVAVTVLAAKRVPALIEFILLQRLSLSAGALYTVKTLSGYVIVAIGMVLTLAGLVQAGPKSSGWWPLCPLASVLVCRKSSQTLSVV